MALAKEGGSTEADTIKLAFDNDQVAVEATTKAELVLEKAETEAVENEK